MELTPFIVASKILWYPTIPFCHVWHSFVVRKPLQNRPNLMPILLPPPERAQVKVRAKVKPRPIKKRTKRKNKQKRTEPIISRLYLMPTMAKPLQTSLLVTMAASAMSMVQIASTTSSSAKSSIAWQTTTRLQQMQLLLLSPKLFQTSMVMKVLSPGESHLMPLGQIHPPILVKLERRTTITVP